MSEQESVAGSESPSLPFDKLTERARKALTLAQSEARRFNHNYIGTEHLLLGLVAEGEGVASQALTNLGVKLEQVRSSVEFIIGRGDRMIVGEIGLTPRVKKVFALALDEAKRLRHRHIGTEHLLLGLIREGEGIAAGVLINLGLTLEQVRTEVVQILVGTRPGPRSTVVMCRLDDAAVEALDMLIEAGVRTTRSDAAAWLIQAGIEANTPLFESVSETVTEIRRLRAQAQRAAERIIGATPVPATDTPPTGQDDTPQPPPAPSAE
jgi:ATP-dependent Clp protease ATP-binding subunit ClpA